jgi:hypothetical protein
LLYTGANHPGSMHVSVWHSHITEDYQSHKHTGLIENEAEVLVESPSYPLTHCFWHYVIDRDLVNKRLSFEPPIGWIPINNVVPEATG